MNLPDDRGNGFLMNTDMKQMCLLGFAVVCGQLGRHYYKETHRREVEEVIIVDISVRKTVLEIRARISNCKQSSSLLCAAITGEKLGRSLKTHPFFGRQLTGPRTHCSLIINLNASS